MEVEPAQSGTLNLPQFASNPNRPRLSLKLTKNPSPVRRTLFSGSQAAEPPVQSFNNSQIAHA